VACVKEERRTKHGKSSVVEVGVSNRGPVTASPGDRGWRRGPYDRGGRVMPAEERGPGSEPTQEVARGRRLGNLSTPISVQKLQAALHAKAKAEPEYRF
jgi:hypothetical protein